MRRARSSIVILALSILAAAPAAFAQCNPLTLLMDTPVSAVAGAVKIQLVAMAESGRASLAGFEARVSEGSWTPDAQAISLLKESIKKQVNSGITRRQLLLQWVDASGNKVGSDLAFLIDASETAEMVCPQAADKTGNPPPHDVDIVSFEECRTKAESWHGELLRIAKERGERGISALVFLPTGQLCFSSPGYPAVGDEIHVGIARFENQEIPAEVTFEPCSLEPETFAIRIGDTSVFKTFEQQKGAEHPKVEIMGVTSRRCFNQSVLITSTSSLPGEVPQKGQFTLSQYNRYRATLQLGVVFSDLHDSEFGLRDSGGQMVVYDKGPVDTGPEYTASLVIYSLPRYFKSLFSTKTHFAGRDILHDNGIADRVGGVFAVGLEDFGDRFAAGLSFELVAGINILGVWEYTKLDELVGLSEGDPFTGKESDIPTREEWEQDFTWGVSIDLRYVTALFQRK